MHPGLEDRVSARCNCTRKEGAIVVEGDITVYTTTHWQSIPSPFRYLQSIDQSVLLNMRKRSAASRGKYAENTQSRLAFNCETCSHELRFWQYRAPLRTVHPPARSKRFSLVGAEQALGIDSCRVSPTVVRNDEGDGSGPTRKNS